MYYSSLWITFWTFTLVLNTAIIFCRFVYIKLATGIMIEGQQLLNISIIVTSLLVVTCWIILWPVLRILFADKISSIPESMKVKICTHSNMTEDFNEESRRYVDFSVRLDYRYYTKLYKGFYFLFLDQNYKSLPSVS